MKKEILKKEPNISTRAREHLMFAASHSEAELCRSLGVPEGGVSEEQAEQSRERYGANVIAGGKKRPLIRRIAEAFVNPFTAVLFAIALVSVFTDIVFAPHGQEDAATVIVIAVMILVSGTLRFVQESRSENAAESLAKMISTTTCVERAGALKREIPLSEVVVGDVIYLSAGDMIPADMRIFAAKDLFVSQAPLTGESEPVEKCAQGVCIGSGITDTADLAFMGCNVLSGTARGVAAAVGAGTMFGGTAKAALEKPPKTSFEKGVNSLSWLLIRFMLVMVPVVLLLNGFTKGSWMEAVLFAISVAVGLTPEMLPMLVTTCLAKGAVAMSHEKVIIKNLNAIQNLGSMDILCTDKTGTLTQDRVALEYHMNVMGEEDDRVLRHAFLNSYYQTGLKNLLDVAIIERFEKIRENPALAGADTRYIKVDEIPFDFERRRMSVVVADECGKTQMITKGAVEEMLRVSAYAEYEGEVRPLTDEVRAFILKKVSDLNDDGMRVIAVAQKTDPSPVGQFSVRDETDMVLIGYLAFFDPPKETAAAAIRALAEHGVAVKILTGDNEKVAACVCAQVGLPVSVLLGTELDDMTDEELARRAGNVTVFAKLSPLQKARVVGLLRADGHSVGYMGDGINDAAAMKASDVGISVDSAVDIAKESASVILLEKDLMVLERGLIEGRRTYANMTKYIKMTVSSNFGNMLSVLAASVFLPFLPMAPIQLLLLNLIYDISCIAVPWDNVDAEFLEKPRGWDASTVGKFMFWMGPASSVFDITTYLVMFFLICPMVCGGGYAQLDPSMRGLFVAVFQAGWFVESMWSQTLVIHMIRTPKIPFIESRASAPLTALTFTGIIALTCIPFTPVGGAVGLAPLPAVYFLYLAAAVVCYMLLATAAKKGYIRKYGTLL